MFDITRKELSWGGTALNLETGRIARQADSAVLASLGDSVVLCSVVGEKTPRPGVDFFPLTVHYVEKTYAAGKIPGGFFKREGRPSENETLVSRLIDRPIRPLFHPDYTCDTQVICTVLSHDMQHDPDICAMIGASAALTLSGLPFLGPVGACRVGYIDDQYVLNPRLDDMEKSDLDLVLAGTREGVLMVESQASELSEDIMLGAINFGHEQIQPVIETIVSMAETCAKPPRDLPAPVEGREDMASRVTSLAENALREAYQETVKSSRQEKVAAAKQSALAALMEGQSVDDQEKTQSLALHALKDLEKNIVRGAILETGQRIDGRDTKTVRPIACEAGVLPRTHGSALFTRGETQALVVTTLGTGQDEQVIDALAGEHRENFMLHYNFPPYSVGEAGRFGFTGRREIGHGKLAWRSLRALLPSHDDFPYTIRVVAEITESNGSSSMASVCGASLSMMDAGVPLQRPVAGIAMGLIKEEDHFAVLSDIIGDEDHLGDMDFKVAGTAQGITSLQMDIKITSITREIMEIALRQAHEGRLHILDEMAKVISSAREEVSGNAPRIETTQIPKDKIRDVIGAGGKVIREICEISGARIDIEDDGLIKVAAVDPKSIEIALSRIEGITAEPEVGRIYSGKVVKTLDFGAFVNFLGPRDGLVHISELTQGRVNQTTDVVREGDQVKVKVLGIDDRGKVKLSMRSVDQETGAEIAQ